MSYQGHFPSTETPKECIERLWDYATKGPILNRANGEKERLPKKIEDPAVALMHSLIYCDWGDDDEEYRRQLAEEAADLLRRHFSE